MNEKRLELPAETLRIIDDNISDLINFTRKTEKEVLELLKQAMLNRNLEWKALSQHSVIDFHRANESSIYCLVKWNSEEKYRQIITYITFICKQKKGNILDFGGGIGELAIMLMANSLNVDFMEVPGNTMSFAKWRFKKRALSIATYTSLNQVGKYDVIICLDVLETLEKPEAHLKKFYQLLNDDGLLILSVGEVGSPSHPMNLEKNKNFLENLDKHCDELGFVDSIYENKFHLKIKKK